MSEDNELRDLFSVTIPESKPILCEKCNKPYYFQAFSNCGCGNKLDSLTKALEVSEGFFRKIANNTYTNPASRSYANQALQAIRQAKGEQS